MQTQKLAILGGGNMGRALIGGLLRQGTEPNCITVGEASHSARSALEQTFGITVTAENQAAVADADLVIVAVKPQDTAHVLKPLASSFRQKPPVVLSIAAGIRTPSLEDWCGACVPVIRAMPNRPAFVGASATALFAGNHANDSHCLLAEETMRAVGSVVWVTDEDALDVVTALSGSGPAYYFLLTECMIEAAVHLGLEREAANKLAIGTLWGSGILAHEGDGDVSRLRAEVTSKGGTTEAALRVFESADLRHVVEKALQAATHRSRELSTDFGSSIV